LSVWFVVNFLVGWFGFWFVLGKGFYMGFCGPVGLFLFFVVIVSLLLGNWECWLVSKGKLICGLFGLRNSWFD